MRIKLNGADHELEVQTSIGELLTTLQLNPERVVLELNNDILNACQNLDRPLKEADKLEIVQFVGGG